MKDKLFQNNVYFFVFAHPDDELYSCALMNRLIKEGKEVHSVHITTGDAGGKKQERAKELKKSLKTIGLKEKNTHLLEIPEKKFLQSFGQIVSSIIKLTKKNGVDCIIGQDYEGGHEGHDGASFCAAEAAKRLGIKNYFVFPIYHGKPQERKGARFKPARKNIIKLDLTKNDRRLKEQVLLAHASQKSHFDGLKKSSGDYYGLLLGREVYYAVRRPMDYLKRPLKQIGYEYHRNGFKFKDFLGSVRKYEKQLSLKIDKNGKTG